VDTPRRHQIHIRCTREEFDAIHGFAKARQRRCADFVRETIFRRTLPTDEIIRALSAVAVRLSASNQSGQSVTDVALVLQEIRAALRALAELDR
jgi:hypothetical protein